MLGDTRPVSFLTYASAQRGQYSRAVRLLPPGAASLPPDPGFESRGDRPWPPGSPTTRRAAPDALAARDARADGSRADRPAARPVAQCADRERPLWGDSDHERQLRQAIAATTMAPSPPRASDAGQVVICPICLHEIQDWDTSCTGAGTRPGRLRGTPRPARPQPDQRASSVRGAYVRCPAPRPTCNRALPAGELRPLWPPVLLGFIGLTKSGKSHLLASMVGAIENGELQDYGITSRPIDHAIHQRFMEDWVNPLLK